MGFTGSNFLWEILLTIYADVQYIFLRSERPLLGWNAIKRSRKPNWTANSVSHMHISKFLPRIVISCCSPIVRLKKRCVSCSPSLIGNTGLLRYEIGPLRRPGRAFHYRAKSAYLTLLARTLIFYSLQWHVYTQLLPACCKHGIVLRHVFSHLKWKSYFDNHNFFLVMSYVCSTYNNITNIVHTCFTALPLLYRRLIRTHRLTDVYKRLRCVRVIFVGIIDRHPFADRLVSKRWKCTRPHPRLTA